MNYKVNEIEIVYKKKVDISCDLSITNSSTSYNIFIQNWEKDVDLLERFYVMFLNRANKVIYISNISKGGISGTIVDAKIIFSTALTVLASSIILAHNHPSGNLKPSKADIELTRKLVKAGELLDIFVLDHLIVTGEIYYSFADEKLMK